MTGLAGVSQVVLEQHAVLFTPLGIGRTAGPDDIAFVVDRIRRGNEILNLRRIDGGLRVPDIALVADPCLIEDIRSGPLMLDVKTGFVIGPVLVIAGCAQAAVFGHEVALPANATADFQP